MGAVDARNTEAALARHAVSHSLAKQRVLWFLFLSVALIVSRWLLEPRYLITFDAINFGLAIDQFNPGLDQPQPPGYPVFVGLLKLLSLLVPKVETVFLVAGFIVSLAALVLVWCLCELIAGGNWGVVGALLLVFNPAFWLAALTNPVRLSLAAGSTAVALCVWQASRKGASLWFPLAAAAFGISAGARPELVLPLAPLMLWPILRGRISWKIATLSLLCFCVTVCTWLPSLVVAVGGWERLLIVFRGYSGEQFGGTSVLFGARLREAIRMAWETLVWSCMGALSWLWAMPFLRHKVGRNGDVFTLCFLGLWFLPGFLFHAIVHVADPDHTLDMIPVTCIAGALVLRALTHGTSRSSRVAAISTCVLLNVFLFFKPISKIAKASTYEPVRWMANYIADVIDGVGDLQGRGPVTAIFFEPISGWRHLSYYSPTVHVIVLLQSNGPALTERHIIGKQVVTRSSDDGVVALPSCGTLAWVDPSARPVATGGSAIETARGRIFFTTAAPGESFEFRGIRFLSGREPCGGASP